MDRIDPEIAGLVKQARKSRSLRIPISDLDEDALKSVVTVMDREDGLSKGLVFIGKDAFFIHPSLILDPTANDTE